MPTRELPHYWTPEQVRQILAVIPAVRPWVLCPAAVALRAAPGGGAQSAVAGPEFCRSRVVPAHPELVDAFRSVPRGRADDSVFHFSDRTAARWIT